MNNGDQLKNFIRDNKGETPPATKNNWQGIEEKIETSSYNPWRSVFAFGLSLATVGIIGVSLVTNYQNNLIEESELAEFMMDTHEQYISETYYEPEYYVFNE